MKTKKARQESQESSAPEAELEAGHDPAGEPESVDRIRDIIFGAQMRDYEARFRRLEQRLAQSVEDLREATQEKLQALNQRLDEALESEGSDRKSGLEQLAGRLKETEKALAEKLSLQGGDTKKALAGLSDRLNEAGSTWEKALKDLGAEIERKLERLGHDKTDRAVLAKWLSKVADGLRAEESARKK